MGQILIPLLIPHQVVLSLSAALSTQFYFAPGLDCGTINANLSGAVIESDDVTRGSIDVCDITLMTSDKWLVHVDHLIMDWCPTSLHLYDTEMIDMDQNSYANFSCGRDQSTVPTTIKFPSNTITLRLVNTRQRKVRFKIVFTAYKEPSECPPEFLCPSGTCISRSLLCDGVDNCLDGRDELVEIAELDNSSVDCFDRRGCAYFSCVSDGLCVPGRFVCDAVTDCQDESDEQPEGRSMCKEEEPFDTSTLVLICVIVGVSFALIGLSIAMAVIWRTRPAVRRRLSFRRSDR